MFSRNGYAFWIATALACGNAIAEEIRWAPDMATARRASMEYKVPMLIHFYGDNCLPCKVLEQNVFTKSEVIQTLNRFFICVRVNASKERQTAAEYGVHSWPTDVFIGPDGKTLDQGLCKQNIADYLGVLQNIAVMNRDRNLMLAAQQSDNAQQVTAQTMNYAQPAQPSSPHAAGLATHLPVAGAPPIANPNGPNYYAQGSGTGAQQLPQSLSPNAGVTSGPMLVQNQPYAVTTAVQASGNQIPGASGQHLPNAARGLPVSSPVDMQISPAHRSSTAYAMTMAYPNLPNMPPATAETSPPNSNWSQSVAFPNSTGQLLDNPHYGAPVATSVASRAPSAGSSPQAGVPQIPPPLQPLDRPSQPSIASNPTVDATAQAKLPASTVSFQPRNASVTNEATNLGQPTAAALENQPKAAIEGFCPVALKKQGAWVKGQPQFAVRHRGRVYWLSTQEAMQEFLASPDRSSPMLSGYDAMVFLNEGKLVEGNIQNGLHEQVSGSILLFSSADTKRAYEKDFDRNTKALNIVLTNAGIQ